VSFPAILPQHCCEIARIDAISIHYRQSTDRQNISKRWFAMNLIHRSAVADRIQLLPPQTLTASAISDCGPATGRSFGEPWQKSQPVMRIALSSPLIGSPRLMDRLGRRLFLPNATDIMQIFDE